MSRALLFAILTMLTQAAWSRAARADTVLSTLSASFSADLDSNANENEQLNGNPTLYLQQYSGTGTLTAVNFTVTATISGTGDVYTTNPNGTSFTTVQIVAQMFDLDANPDAPAPLQFLINDPNSGGTFSPFYESGTTTLTSQNFSNLTYNTLTPLNPFSANGTTTASFTAPGDVSTFVGSNVYSFSPFSSIVPTSTAPNVNINTSLVVSETITVQYIGTIGTVPEPSSFALASIAGLSAALMVFHRRQAIRA